MLSIIVCSVKAEKFKEFSDSVAATVNIPFEIIKIDNSQNEFSICSAYNEGTRRARYDLLCFSHEDIIMHTEGWGSILVQILADKTIGLVGVFGICFYNLFPYGWQDAQEFEGQLFVGALPGTPKSMHIRFPSEHIAEVVGVDGMFMVTRKEVVQRFPFSENVLNGFHGYDIDLAMQVRSAYRIVVTRDILLTHESGGHFNQEYFDALSILDKKWAGHFPIYINKYSKEELRTVKMRSLIRFIKENTSLKKRIGRHILCLRYAGKHEFLLRWTLYLIKAGKRKTIPVSAVLQAV